LVAAGGFWLAGANLVGSVIVGFVAVWLGSRLALRF
jgi:fluoride ion exporter CrcB/FEX